MGKLTDADKLMDADIYLNLYRLPSLPSQSTTVQFLQKNKRHTITLCTKYIMQHHYYDTETNKVSTDISYT